VIDLFYFNGLPVAVLGLGTSGLAAAKALQASGADVWAWDDNEDSRAAAAAEDVPLGDLSRHPAHPPRTPSRGRAGPPAR
jgi:UDP-N-acetylmuramoylalanine--D-glutamate ligase